READVFANESVNSSSHTQHILNRTAKFQVTVNDADVIPLHDLRVVRVPRERTIPEDFDARKAWPNCPSISKIINQGECETNWALSIASVLTDRVCVAKRVHFKFSAQDLLTCCKHCKEDEGICSEGIPAHGWFYVAERGLPSEVAKSCSPYNIDSESCKSSCSERTKVPEVYKLGKPIVQQIQSEITANGPVQAIMDVEDDFVYNYTDSVYSCAEKYDGVNVHLPKAVKIIGWGQEKDGEPYWLAANFMGSKWGKMGGFFKIARGVNTCGIEDHVMLGKMTITEELELSRAPPLTKFGSVLLHFNMNTFVICIFFALLVFTCNAESEEIIRLINQRKSTWVAGRNFPENVTTGDLKRLNGALGVHPNPYYKFSIKVHEITLESTPQSFDARQHWPRCEDVINTIRNQAMTDRLCIERGNTKFKFSPEDLLECCTNCGNGCEGGYSFNAWKFWRDHGIVSGGDYNSNEGCKPYSVSSFVTNTAPKCHKTCQNEDYNATFIDDKHFGTTIYKVDANAHQIQAEILTNGPVEANFLVYEDFYSYQTGVYQHVYGEYMGGHSVKIVGWGVENGTPYWLAANSWGLYWGGLNGFFKILRGDNHCKIEANVVAGKVNS
ncbi:Peptidase C1 and/or Propeptide C1 domain containing protein, partial [Asbolus verrucosus]